MMMDPTRKFSRRENAQALTEFALIVPLLLLIVYGLIEFGRLLAIYSMITTASREGSRYGAAAGENAGGTVRYEDCDGILAATRKQALLVTLEDEDIEIFYDHGPDDPNPIEGCPPSYDIHLGDRIGVRVQGRFEPLVLFINLAGMDIVSQSSRTIVKDVTVEGTLAAPGPTNTPVPGPTDTPTPTATPTHTPTYTPTPTDTPTTTPTTPGAPSVTPTFTPTPTQTGTPTSTATNTPLPSPTPVCDIFDSNQLNIDGPNQRVSWQVLNQRAHTLVLSSLTIGWAMPDTPAPTLDYIQFGSGPGVGVTIWNGNVSASPATISAWSGFDSDRTLYPYPSDARTVSLTFTRPLQTGPYSLSLTFHNVELNVYCTVDVDRYWNAP